MSMSGLPVGYGRIGRIARNPVLVLLVAFAAFAGLFVVRVAVGTASDALLVLYVLPIALVAARFGRWGGLAAAALGLALFAVWAMRRPPGEIGQLAYLTRGTLFVLVGFGIGWYVEWLCAAVRAVYASEDRYRAMLEHAPEAIVVLDVELDSFRQFNHRAVSLFGLSRDQLEPLGLGALSPSRQPDGRLSDAVIQEKITQAVAGRQLVFRWTFRTGDGHDLPCEVRLRRLPDPERVLVRGSLVAAAEHTRGTAVPLVQA
jgi:PAS domain S-box-containing protein